MTKNMQWMWCGLLFMASLLSSAPARAVETISWSDFYKYGQACGYECTRYDWVEVYDCSIDPYTKEQYCDYYLEQRCVETAYICRDYRLTLSDGDIVDYAIGDGGQSQGYEIVLKKPKTLTWWKGIKAYRNNDNSSYAGEVSLQDSATESGMLSFTPYDTNAYLIFAKAKFLGIHTDMYRLTIAPGMATGKRCTFTWQQD